MAIVYAIFNNKEVMIYIYYRLFWIQYLLSAKCFFENHNLISYVFFFTNIILFNIVILKLFYV